MGRRGRLIGISMLRDGFEGEGGDDKDTEVVLLGSSVRSPAFGASFISSS